VVCVDPGFPRSDPPETFPQDIAGRALSAIARKSGGNCHGNGDLALAQAVVLMGLDVVPSLPTY
jgi:hypothetical protein